MIQYRSHLPVLCNVNSRKLHDVLIVVSKNKSPIREGGSGPQAANANTNADSCFSQTT